MRDLLGELGVGAGWVGQRRGGVGRYVGGAYLFRAYLCAQARGRGEVRGGASVFVCGSHSQALEVAHVGLAAVHAAGRERGVQLRRTGDGGGGTSAEETLFQTVN